MHRIEGANYTVEDNKHLFKDDPPATTVPAAWLNAVQEEICNAIELSGIGVRQSIGDPHTQLYEAIRKQDSYDYIVNSPQSFYDVVERTAANQYQFKSSYNGIAISSVYVKNITNGYNFTTLLTGGDTWGKLSTNGIKNLVFESGAFINVGDTKSYLNSNTDNGYLKDVGIKGIGTSSAAIVYSFTNSANKVFYDGCWTSDRNISGITYNAFFDTTFGEARFDNCQIFNIVSDSAVYGFYRCYNLNNCLIYDNSVNSIICFHSCYNINNAYMYNSTGVVGFRVEQGSFNMNNIYVLDTTVTNATTNYLFYTGGNISNVFVITFDITASTNSIFFYQTQRINNVIIQSGTNSKTATGFSDCQYITNAWYYQVSCTAGNNIAFDSCKKLEGCYCNSMASTSASGSVGFKSCVGVVNCEGSGVGNSGAGAGYGFDACFRCYGNTGSGNKTALFNACYFSSDNSVATAAGNGNA